MTPPRVGVEVLGLDQSITYAETLARFADEHTATGNETYLQRLAAARVTGDGLATGRQMQAAFADAAAAAHRHATDLATQRGVQEAYEHTPDAGDKTWLTNHATTAAGATAQSDAPKNPDGKGRPVSTDTAAVNGRDDEPDEPDGQAGGQAGGGAAPRCGGFNPDQPRGDDGRWIKVGDALGYADDETCYGTDRVTGTGPVNTDLALMEYPEEPGVQQGAFVSISTSPHEYNPVTGKETPHDPDESQHIYAAPQLGAGEAETLAQHVEDLANLAESGYQPPTPTKHTRARQQLQHLVDEGHARRRDHISVGEDEDFPLTTGELLKLLEEADPTMSATQTRRKVRAKAASDAGGEDGTVWVDLETDAAGVPRVVVTAVEGADTPDSEYNRRYAAQHSPASARELAGKLRAFAGAARKRKRR